MKVIIVDKKEFINHDGESVINGYLVNEKLDVVDSINEVYQNGELTPEAQLKLGNYMGNPIFATSLEMGIDFLKEEALESDYHYQIQSKYLDYIFG
jgi:hypothetical protein